MHCFSACGYPRVSMGLSMKRSVMVGILACSATAYAGQGVRPDGKGAVPADALEPVDTYHLVVSPYTYHFSHSPEHKHVYMVGLERTRAGREVAGAVYFSNSFGQPSTFIYPWGRVYNGLFAKAPEWYVKWGAGLLYGYREPYENKVPLNTNGFSPGFILSIGRPVSASMGLQLNLLGNSGLMFQASMRIR